MPIYFNTLDKSVKAQGFKFGPHSFIESNKRITNKDIFIIDPEGGPIEPTVAPIHPEVVVDPEPTVCEPKPSRWARFLEWIRTPRS